MRKILLAGASLLTAVTLTACNNNDEEGLNTRYRNDGYETIPTRYNETIDTAPNRDRLEMDRDEFGPDYYNGRDLTDDRNTINNNDNYGEFGNNDVNRTRRNNNDANDNDTFELADQVADRITNDVKEVERAYVFTGPENAYVGVVLEDENTELTEELKARIRRAAKSADRNIDDVFISANPDFIKSAEDYANDLESGDPIEGLFEEMGDMFERVFPDNG
jgi:spore cortex protein